MIRLCHRYGVSLLFGVLVVTGSAQVAPGELLVSCGDTEVDSTLQRFSPAGAPLGVFFQSPLEMQRPGGMAVALDGQILVTSIGTSQVLTVQPTSGSLMNILGPMVDGSLVVPTDIVSKGSGYALSDFDGGAVRFLDSGISTFVDRGEFGSSSAHMVRRNGILYVSDTPNGRVWSANLVSGETSLVVAGQGLICPTGLAFDAAGRLLIADSYQNRLYRWDGLALTSLAAGPPLDAPRGLAVAPGGSIIVANEGSGQLLRYSQAGVLLGTFASGLTTPTHLMFYKAPHPGDGFANLEFCQDTAMSHLFIELRRPVNGTTAEIIGPIPIDPGGYFTFGSQLDGVYNVYAWAPHYLRRFVGQLNTGSLIGLSCDLINGDCDGDNEVGIGDFALLSASYSTLIDEEFFDARADLNCDEAVDIGDYAILSMNYGLVGD